MAAAGEAFPLKPALAAREASVLGNLVSLRPLTDPRTGRTIGLVLHASDPALGYLERLARCLFAAAPEGTVSAA